MDRRGVEPRSPACDAGVVPLDQQPVNAVAPHVHPKGPPENRTRSPSLPRRCAAGTPADRLPGSRPGRTRTCAILLVRQASSPLDDGTRFGRVARVGFDPTGTRLSTWPRCQLAYRAVNTDSCGSGSRTSASERMKLGRAPAHPQSQAPVSSRADRPHESQPGTCLAWEISRRGEIRTPTPRGHVLLRPARLPVPPPGESSYPVQWSVRESNPPLQLEGLVSSR
jgi:hypothetical protein